MSAEIKLKRIISFYIAIFFVNNIIPVQGQMNIRKMQLSNSNSDNYIIASFSERISYTDSNPFNKGKRNMVSYLKFSNTIIEKDAENKFTNFALSYDDLDLLKLVFNLEIHFSSCVSSLANFFGCDKEDEAYFDENSQYLSEVDFSHFDSSCLESTKKLFYNCPKLYTAYFSNFKPTKVTDMSYMFYNCKDLHELDLSDFDTSNVMDMSYLFYNCCNLYDLNISDFDTSKVTNMSYMFYDFGGCFHFEFLDLSSFDTSNVIDMSYMFYNLLPGEFASLDLSGFDTSKVTNMKGIFEKTPSLYLLNLSNFDISKVDNISKMLYDMEDITFLDLTGFNFENIEDDQINEFFNPKLDLKFLNIKDIKSKDAFIDFINNLEKKKHMYLCLNDPNLIPKIDKSIIICCDIYEESEHTYECDSSNYFSLYYETSVTYDSGFSNDDRNQIAFLKNNNWRMISVSQKITVPANKNLDIKFAFPIDNLNNFFDNNEQKNSLISLDFSNFDSSKLVSVENLFNELTSLKYIDLSNFGGALTSMKGLFKDLNSLESIKLNNIKTSKVTSIESMFENCASLTSIDLTDLDTTSLINMQKLFSGCSALKIIDFSNLNMENVHSVSDIFNGIGTNFEYIILTNAKLSDELFSEIKDELTDKYYYIDCSTSEIIQNGDYKCCDSDEETNCFYCLNNKIIFYDKISFLEGKEQISCENIDITKYYLKEEGAKKFYSKCENAITNCDECSSEEQCTKCKTGYAFKIESSSIECVEEGTLINNKHFYTTDSGITYYSCNSYNDIINCDECSNGNTCNKCIEGYSLKYDNSIECVLKTSISSSKQFYTNDTGITYYSCSLHSEIDKCSECTSRNKCDKCQTNYAFKIGDYSIECVLKTSLTDGNHFYTNDSEISYYSCSLYNDIANCDECTNRNTCTKCKTGYAFKIESSSIECVEEGTLINNKHFYTPDSGITYYSCNSYNDIINCDECTNRNTCDKCPNYYAFKRESSSIECVLKTSMINNKQFYTDDSGINYYLCSRYNSIDHCEECSNDNTCNKCENGYVLKRTNIYECIEEGSLSSDKQFYTNDSGITYYSCNLYNDIDNCYECSNDNTCDVCLADYTLYNNKKLCVRQIDIDNNLYVETNPGIYSTCSSLIQDCKKCSNADTCLVCQEGAGLTINNACVNEALVQQNHEYYKDENDKYISCSIMSNCHTCNSGSVCTSCQEGFNLDNNKCIKSVEDDKDSGLSKGAIVGISFGSVLVLLIIIGIAYIIYKKIIKKNKNSYQQTYDVCEISKQKTERSKDKENQPQDSEKRNSENCVVYKRRSVSNQH